MGTNSFPFKEVRLGQSRLSLECLPLRWEREAVPITARLLLGPWAAPSGPRGILLTSFLLTPPPRGARGATAKCFKEGLSFFFTCFTPQFETVSVLLLGNALCMDKVTGGSCINADRVQEILDVCFSPCVAVTGELGHTACVGKGYSGSMHQRPPTQLHDH